LIVPSFDGLKSWCKIKEIAWTDNASMLKEKAIQDKFLHELDKTNEGLAQYEKIKKIKVVEGPWTVDTGDMTPSLKLKRKILMAKYAKEVEAIYRE
jgi:long-chain acyl-CoA synthetase